MSNIDTYLEDIMTAVYGKDVRQSIHDAIKQCYEDGSSGISKDEIDSIEESLTAVRRKVLAITAGMKEADRWVRKTYYEITAINTSGNLNGIVKFRFGGRSVSIDMLRSHQTTCGLVRYIYAMDIPWRLVFCNQGWKSTSVKFYFDGREKDFADLDSDDVYDIITIVSTYENGGTIIQKLNATGIHIYMNYPVVPSVMPSLCNTEIATPNFSRVMYKDGGNKIIELNAVSNGRLLTTVQDSTWTANEWHQVDILW